MRISAVARKLFDSKAMFFTMCFLCARNNAVKV